jgi:hypothetical protein
VSHYFAGFYKCPRCQQVISARYALRHQKSDCPVLGKTAERIEEEIAEWLETPRGKFAEYLAKR